MEVLRDGAGAQYGSDAVAGVLNFVLRDAPEGGSLETNLGQSYHGDGDRLNVAANIGLPLTEAGFANFSFEFTNADSTNRSVQRDDARRMIENGNAFIRRSAAQPWGAPDVKYDYKFFGNLGLDLGDDHQLYAFGNYAEREIEDTFYWRNPASFPGVFAQGDELLVADLSADGRSGNCPTITASDYVTQGPAALAPLMGLDDCYALAQAFPGGFTPRFRGVVNDWSLVFGLRGSLRVSTFDHGHVTAGRLALRPERRVRSEPHGHLSQEQRESESDPLQGRDSDPLPNSQVRGAGQDFQPGPLPAVRHRPVRFSAERGLRPGVP